jgi:hypothetical protein
MDVHAVAHSPAPVVAQHVAPVADQNMRVSEATKENRNPKENEQARTHNALVFQNYDTRGAELPLSYWF